jgi:hypothetical protein
LYTYYKQYPIAPGQTPESSVCSRPKYTKAIVDMLLAKTPCTGIVVYKFYYYYYYTSSDTEVPLLVNSIAELPRESSLAGRIELPGDSIYIPNICDSTDTRGFGCSSSCYNTRILS